MKTLIFLLTIISFSITAQSNQEIVDGVENAEGVTVQSIQDFIFNRNKALGNSEVNWNSFKDTVSNTLDIIEPNHKTMYYGDVTFTMQFIQGLSGDENFIISQILKKAHSPYTGTEAGLIKFITRTSTTSDSDQGNYFQGTLQNVLLEDFSFTVSNADALVTISFSGKKLTLAP